MRHAREDYARIQDPSGKIPEDEPVFLLRGQDPLAAKAVAYYCRMLEQAGADKMMIALIRDQVKIMHAWTPKKTLPDLPGGTFATGAKVLVDDNVQRFIARVGGYAGATHGDGMYLLYLPSGLEHFAHRNTMTLI